MAARLVKIGKASLLQKPLQVVRFALNEVQDGFAFRTRNNEIKAFANVVSHPDSVTMFAGLYELTLRVKCVHRGVELDWDSDGDFFDADGFLRCKAHDAKFDPTTGVCVRGPRNCVGKRKLYELSIVEQSGELFAGNLPDHMLDFRKDFRLPGAAAETREEKLATEKSETSIT